MPEIKQLGRRRRIGLFLLTAASVVAIDQATKLCVRAHLLPGESLPEIGLLRLIHVQNTGSAFGLFANQGFLLSLIAIVGLIVILLFYHYLPESSILITLAFGLIFGGAVGNLIDRLRLGYVTDFIDVRLWHDFHWPAFNAADSAITVGAISLACFIFWTLKKESGHTSDEASS